MNYNSQKYLLIKGVFLLLIFQLLHYLYDWTLSPVVAVFSGIDESNFQHWKIGFWVYLIFIGLETKIFAKEIDRKEDFIFAGLISSVLFPWIIFIIWYSIQSFAGPFTYMISEVIYAITSTYLCAIICHIINRELIQLKFSKSMKIVIIILLVIFIFELTWFTFNSPWTDVFSIPTAEYI